MTNPTNPYTRDDGSIDVFGALEGGDALRQRTANLSIRRGSKRLVGALATVTARPGAWKGTNETVAETIDPVGSR